MPFPRDVQPEILDHLPPDDPEARRSRRDIRRIHALMGNERWALRTVTAEARPGSRIVELGGGDGHLCAALARRGFAVTGCDLQERPEGLPPEVSWKHGDIRETLPGLRGEVAVAVLFLHHFDDETLATLGQSLREGFERLVLCEPFRCRLALLEGGLIWPFVNRVTRHDMMVSVRAAFRPGDLPARLGLQGEDWEWTETTTLRGGLRMVARRRKA